jgi:3-oxoacyl-[acyl-carrier protein] reductase
MDNKYALVTGASRGLGRAISIKLATMGYHILVHYNAAEDQANITAEAVRALGVQAEIIRFDLGDKVAVESEMTKWMEANPDKKIEVLVNNGGIRKDNLLMMMPTEDWDSVMNTNLNSFFYLTRMVIMGMLSGRYGRIINIASLSGIKGMPGQTNYSATKAGLIGATKALAQEVGRRGVTVNAVAPGFIKTDMTEGIQEEDFKKMIPINRFGTPEEVAAAVGFLASKDASYITGETISVNGGLYT